MIHNIKKFNNYFMKKNLIKNILLIFYTFETLFFTGIIYLLLIPISFFHYRNKNKKSSIASKEQEQEEDEDVL